MKAKFLLSRIALVLALILALSTFAACDLGSMLGSGSDEKSSEKTTNSKVKTYIYNEDLPDSFDEINEKAWKASSKVALCKGLAFEPGIYQTYLGKIENTDSRASTYQLYFNTKGNVNPIADYISLSITVTTEDGEILANTQIPSLGSYLGNKKVFLEAPIGANCTYYVSITFYMPTDDENSFDAYDIGANVYLACKSSAISSEQDSFGNSYDTTGTHLGTDGNTDYSTNEWHSAISSNSIPENTDWYESSDYETTPSDDVAQELYIGGTSYDWTSSNHSSNSLSSVSFVACESGYICFIYDIDSEENCDKFYVYINGSEYFSTSGMREAQLFSAYVNAGDTIMLAYSKDGSVDVGSDTVWVYDIALENYCYETESSNSFEDTSYYFEDTSYYEEYSSNICDELPSLEEEYWIYETVDNFYYAEEVNDYGEHEYFYFYSNNHDPNSSSTLSFIINHSGNLTFSVFVPSEFGCDYLTIKHNGYTLFGEVFSGMNDWNEEMYINVSEGDVVSFVYSKDGSINNGDDCAYIRNLTFTPTENEPLYDFPSETAPLEDCIYFESNEFEIADVVDNDGNFLYTKYYAVNYDHNSSSSMVMVAQRSGVLYFETLASSELDHDGLYIYVNNLQLGFLSGSWAETSYELINVEAGDRITLTYSKDGSYSYYDDTVYVSNFIFMPTSEEESTTEEFWTETAAETEYETFENVSDPFYEFPYETENIDACVRVEYNEFSSDYIDSYYNHFPTNHASGSKSSMALNAIKSGYIYFEHKASTERDCDVLRVYINGDEQIAISGLEETYGYQLLYVNEGDYIIFEYSKDGSVDYGDDTVYLRNFNFMPLVIYEDNIDDYFSIEYSGFASETETDVYGNANMVYYSTNHDDSSSSSMSLTALYSGTLSFEYSISSESNFDRFRFYLNSDAYLDISGIYDHYETYSFEVNVGDVITFEYSKDGSGYNGNDCAYLRNFCFVAYDMSDSVPEDTWDTEAVEETDTPTSACLITDFWSATYYNTYDYESNGTHTVWYTCNMGSSNSHASLGFSAPGNGYISFDYTISTEENYDLFKIIVNDIVILEVSGNITDSCAFEVSAGDSIELVYQKDGGTDAGTDMVTLTDIMFHPGY